MRLLLKQPHTELMSKFSAIYRWHHTRRLLKHSQNKYHAQIKFSCPTYIRKQSFHPHFTSPSCFFKEIYDRAARQLLFLALEQARPWFSLNKNWADVCGDNYYLSHQIFQSLLKACSKQRKEKKKKDGVGGVRSDSSSRQTWLNNHCLINQDLTVPPIVISQDVNKLLLSLYFLESIETYQRNKASDLWGWTICNIQVLYIYIYIIYLEWGTRTKSYFPRSSNFLADQLSTFL